MSEANRRRGVEKSWMKQSIEKRQAGDIYGFGMVMYEILFRSLPYPDKTDITELVEYIRDGSRTVRPSIQNRENMNPDLMSLLLDCWSENPDARPKGSLVDQMMRLMEQYANNLEKLVQERTGMLEEANKRADNLLSQLLPRYRFTT
uniref:guanylate cyclase n=1 Tax=Parascaris equorum TaxID=6256 RepID=A0A914RZL6_PAREQ